MDERRSVLELPKKALRCTFVSSSVIPLQHVNHSRASVFIKSLTLTAGRVEIKPNQSADPAPPTHSHDRVGSFTGPKPRGGQKRGHLSLGHENNLNLTDGGAILLMGGWTTGGRRRGDRREMRRTNMFTLTCCITCFHFWFNSSTKVIVGPFETLIFGVIRQRIQVSSAPFPSPGQMKRLLIVCFGLPPLAALLHIQVCMDGMYREKGVLYLSLSKSQKHSCHRSL